MRKILLKVCFLSYFLLILGSCSDFTEKKTYVIARDPSWYPLNLFGKERQLQAFTDELLREIAKDQKIKITLVKTSPTSLFTGLIRGDYDGVVSSFFPIAYSRQQLIASNPFYRIGPVLVVPTYSQISSLKDLKGKTIGILRRPDVIDEIQKRFDDINIVTYSNVGFALDNVVEGKWDGVLVDMIRAYVYTQGVYEGILKIVSPPLTKRGIRVIALREKKEGVQLIDKINKGLEKMYQNGTYERLVEKWDIPDAFMTGGKKDGKSL